MIKFIVSLCMIVNSCAPAWAASPIIGGTDGPTFIAPTIFKEVVEPSSPAAGYQKVWISSVDGRMYRKTSAGAVVEVGPDISGKLNNPMTTNGDMIYQASGVPARLAIGASNTVQVSSGSAPGWAKILNANIDTAAAIAYSKLDLANGIVNADVNSSAAIAYSKLNLSGAITNSDVNSSAAIDYSKLALTGSIVNADINASAGIADTKLATISTSGKVSNSATTATSSNTNSAIVARDGSGNFSAGTITANLTGAVTGNASTATALAANPADCASDRYATTIAASGDLTCAQVTNAGLAGSIAASKLVGTDIATVGTITSGTWQGSVIGTTYGGTGQSTLTGLNIPSLATDIVTFDGQAGTPSNPSSGFFKIFVDDTSGKPKILNSAGTVSSLGGGGGSSGINVLSDYNRDAEAGTAFWTNSGGTFTTTTTAANVANGLASFSFDASSSSQTVVSDARAIPAGLYGANCLLDFYYKGFDSNIKAQAWDGTNPIAEVTLGAAAGFVKQSINFICPTSGNIQMRLVSSADAAIGYWDEVHLGSAVNLTQSYSYESATSYTPAITHNSGGITNSTTTASYTRIGDHVWVEGKIVFSGASASFSGINLGLPSAYPIDLTYYRDDASGTVYGCGSWIDSGVVGGYVCATSVGSGNTTAVQLRYSNTASGTNPVNISHTALANNAPVTFNSGDAIGFKFDYKTSAVAGTSKAISFDSPLDTTGMLIPFGNSTCPAGSIAADGTAVSRTQYAALFNKIGTTFGSGDGSTTFNVPNTSGLFLRGTGTQTIGGVATPTISLGTVQGDQIQGHVHNITGATAAGAQTGIARSGSVSGTGGTIHDSGSPSSDGVNGAPRTGSETRPANIGVKFCIVTNGAQTTSVVLGAPTIQKFTTAGSGTYVTPKNVRYIEVEMAGAGGGGGGSGTGTSGGLGSAGGNTTFGTSLLTAAGGTGGQNTNVGPPGSGGAATVNSPAVGQGWSGGNGASGHGTGTVSFATGGAGGANSLGGAANGTINATSFVPAANTGAGGAGGGTGASAAFTGNGGGAGAYIRATIYNPSGTYPYTVGAGGTLGSAGTNGIAGSKGSDGIIIVKEYY